VAALTSSLTAGMVTGLPAPTSPPARTLNSAGKGRGMGEASQEKPDPQTISGDQTTGYFAKPTKPTAVAHFAFFVTPMQLDTPQSKHAGR
jgi:hypothetical protein